MLVDTSVFKDTRGKYRTKSLFKEYETSAYPAYFTLGPEDLDSGRYVSLKRKYLEIADPTEWEFVERTLGDWNLFKLLETNCQWFRDELESWRKELDIKLRSRAISRIKEIMDRGPETTTRLSAAKYLASQEYKSGTEKRKAGRPSKAEIERERKVLARQQSDTDNDAYRIGIGETNAG